MNLLESILAAVTKPTQPLHAGEAFFLWTYCAALEEGRSLCLFLMNQTTDPDLKRIMEHSVANVEEPQIERLHQFLKENGINVPPVTPDKAKADPLQIPAGARLIDSEIANMLVGKYNSCMQILAAGLLQSLRNDVGAMLYQFQGELLKTGFVLKETMRQRGWLRMPPLYGPAPSP